MATMTAEGAGRGDRRRRGGARRRRNGGSRRSISCAASRLCGILLMNITGFGLPDAYANPTNAGGANGANLWAWIVTEMGFEGTQRALFSMLFGASAILLTSRLEAAGPDRRGRHLFPPQSVADRLRPGQRLRLPLVRRHPLRLRRHRLVPVRVPQHGGEAAAGARHRGAAPRRRPGTPTTRRVAVGKHEPYAEAVAARDAARPPQPGAGGGDRRLGGGAQRFQVHAEEHPRDGRARIAAAIGAVFDAYRTAQHAGGRARGSTAISSTCSG